MCCEVISEAGCARSGIFREAADIDAVRQLASQVDVADYSAFDKTSRQLDVLVYCDLLKMWFRKMPLPLVPGSSYDQCICAGRSGSIDMAKVCCMCISCDN